jgi:hypothetical protein
VHWPRVEIPTDTNYGRALSFDFLSRAFDNAIANDCSLGASAFVSGLTFCDAAALIFPASKGIFVS